MTSGAFRNRCRRDDSIGISGTIRDPSIAPATPASSGASVRDRRRRRAASSCSYALSGSRPFSIRKRISTSEIDAKLTGSPASTSVQRLLLLRPTIGPIAESA